MKTINELEQEAEQAREELCVNMVSYLPISSRNAGIIADQLILASVAMVTYQFALGMQEASGDGSGESLSEYIEKKGLSNITASQDYLTGDGWIEWGGGLCPVDTEIEVEYKMRFSEDVHFSKALYLEWGKDIVERDWDIVAYRIVKGE